MYRTRIALLLMLTATPLRAAPVESFVEAPGPLGPLKGTMLSAGSNAPAVLIIPGSGPTDRDGNNPVSLKAAPYKLVAEGLAQKGISSVRVDKRGLFASAAAVADPNAVTIDDYARDAHAWITSIRKSTGASCVWILGHSEGALVALVAGKNSADICGLVLVSGAGRSLDQVLREQLKANPANAPILDQALSAIDSLKAGQHVDAAKLNPVLLSLFRPQVQDFLINQMSYDPAALVAAFKKPVLILQGQRDLQVSVADAQLLAKADPNAKLVLLPNANHVLKTVTGDTRAANLATYADPSLPLADGVVDAIVGFIAPVK